MKNLYQKGFGAWVIILIVFILVLVAGVIVLLNSQRSSLGPWKDIIPGENTKEDVIKKLGIPEEEIDMPFGRSMIYESGIESLPNVVIYDETTQKVVGMLVTLSDRNEGESYYNQMVGLGNPEKIMYGALIPNSRVYIFPPKGVTFSGQEEAKIVYGIHYFVPMSLNDYLTKYGKFYSDTNPFGY